jgi:hypothetical protein
MTSSEVVRDQVDAFNRHDIDAFMATYAHDAVVVGVVDAPLVGHAELRTFYESRLRSDADLRCEIETLVAFGTRWVVARELISSRTGEVETIATFDVADGLIQRASMLKA